MLEEYEQQSLPFPGESESESLAKSKSGRFSGLSLISSPTFHNNYQISQQAQSFLSLNWSNFKLSATKCKSRAKGKRYYSQKASSGDWWALRFTLTITGLSSAVFGRAEELSPTTAIGIEN